MNGDVLLRAAGIGKQFLCAKIEPGGFKVVGGSGNTKDVAFRIGIVRKCD